MPEDGFENASHGIPAEALALLDDFPRPEDVALPDIPSTAAAWGREAAEGPGGDPLTWAGPLNSNGTKDGVWVARRNDGRPKQLVVYQDGHRVNPSATFHENGALQSYQPRVDPDGAFQGLGWMWYADGQLRSAITWKDHQMSGPAVFLTPEGLPIASESGIMDGVPPRGF